MHVEERFWLTKYYSQLVGCKIVKFNLDADRHAPDVWWPQFTCEQPNGEQFVIELSCDQEGNNAGFLFGLPEVLLNMEDNFVN